jgi:hypothetical protein
MEKKILCPDDLLYKKAKNRKRMHLSSICRIFRCALYVCKDDFLCQSDAVGREGI